MLIHADQYPDPDPQHWWWHCIGCCYKADFGCGGVASGFGDNSGDYGDNWQRGGCDDGNTEGNVSAVVCNWYVALTIYVYVTVLFYVTVLIWYWSTDPDTYRYYYLSNTKGNFRKKFNEQYFIIFNDLLLYQLTKDKYICFPMAKHIFVASQIRICNSGLRIRGSGIRKKYLRIYRNKDPFNKIGFPNPDL